MSAEKQPRTKTLTLSLRLDPKTKFILDFLARIKGQSITTVVERALKETADGLGLGPAHDHEGDPIPQQKWSKFWDPSEGIRTLRLIESPYYPTTFDEDEIKVFVEAHKEFFYLDWMRPEPRRAFVDILWPKIEEYLEIWREQKSVDYWAAGKAMKADLTAAGLETPEWPRKSSATSAPTAKAPAPAAGPGLDDDEIPF